MLLPVADGHGYRVLPGGLRASQGDTASPARPAERYAEGRWSDRGADVSRRPAGASISSPSIAAAPTCSRVADNLYWLGRYIERLDNDARSLRTAVMRVAQGVIGPRELWSCALGRPLDRANLPTSPRCRCPRVAFQQGLAAVASEKRGLPRCSKPSSA
jgi:hypothetical protein